MGKGSRNASVLPGAAAADDKGLVAEWEAEGLKGHKV